MLLTFLDRFVLGYSVISDSSENSYSLRIKLQWWFCRVIVQHWCGIQFMQLRVLHFFLCHLDDFVCEGFVWLCSIASPRDQPHKEVSEEPPLRMTTKKRMGWSLHIRMCIFFPWEFYWVGIFMLILTIFTE